MTESNIAPLDGYLRQEGGWTYDFEIHVTKELADEQIRLENIEKQLESDKARLRNSIAAQAKKFLPTEWSIKSVGIICYSKVKVISSAHGLRFNEAIPKPKPEPAVPKPVDPYEALASRYDIKQIWHSNILTREEKRRILGLPDLPEGEKP